LHSHFPTARQAPRAQRQTARILPEGTSGLFDLFG
jgi:hypothetical protein